MDFAAARKVMVDSQVRVNDVTDRALQAALLAVPRERFLPPERAYAAYAEIEPEIAAGRRLMLARDLSKLLMALDARAGETALAMAGPYAAAVLARLGLTVTAQEGDPAVFGIVGPVLAEEGVAAVAAPLSTPSGEGFDIIISEAAVPGRPETWLEALKVGGRMAVVERSGPVGKAVLYVRGEQGVSRRELFNAAPPVLAELSPEPAFAL
ncbi:MAG: protein-L-isoaspartate O-methyltransferase [Brevundimonas sp.]|uniref:protein-L-isoaspartate O-methyltransferase family protein n=1 Tax=Brevundimonas sp. TaxID=1871086 RepID=UPI0027200BBD|nr:protein-L-isoaspartate O-methyltransferase [Brevundimonas sp.]MDO9589379.1 protein-L-isoaspartate O-methyltransferase [Brevundimonas sp.]MDP3370323.1 protein-L-isoaspartate O-methyltransferase [Brevundimonas sp.]MDP3656236.1 protein-L-isoaspartate O-methyltransferase [Brevundimonas sp.]MDZ4113101.1 protein-L-isoaspartate O-methyltransferase [Brevundimonas sp.]